MQFVKIYNFFIINTNIVFIIILNYRKLRNTTAKTTILEIIKMPRYFIMQNSGLKVKTFVIGVTIYHVLLVEHEIYPRM
jgi:hypothetical protein